MYASSRLLSKARKVVLFFTMLALLTASLGMPAAKVIAAPSAGGFMPHPTATFAPPECTDANPYQIADFSFGDVDHDNDDDVLVTQNRICDHDAIWLNDGHGVFSNPIYLDYGVAGIYGDSTSGTLADFNGDGWVDVLISNFLNPSTFAEFIWINNGNGTFANPVMFNEMANFTRIAVVGNVDNAGGLDIVTLNGPESIRIYLNSGGASWTLTPGAVVANPATDSAPIFHGVLKNLDADSDLDLVLSTGAGIYVMLNDGTGGFAPHPTTPHPTTAVSLGSVVGDLDGDGDMDMVVGMNNAAQVFTGDALGNFTYSYSISGASFWRLEMGDVEDDGDLDVILTDVDTTADQIFVNDGHGVLTLSTVTPTIAAGLATYAVRLHDIDHDDDLDLLTAASGESARVWLNNVAPVTSDVIKAGVPTDATVTFTTADFASVFTDADGTALHSIQVTVLPTNGTLNLSGTPVTVGQVIPSASLANLTYVPPAGWTGNPSFTWLGSDGSVYSNASLVSMTIGVVNDPPVITAVTKTAVDEDTIITFTASDFTNQYSDPELTPLVSIQVPALPSASLGVLYLNGVALTAGTAIPAANIPTLTFDPAPNLTGAASFNWRASDGISLSNTSAVNMTFNAVNDVPTIGPVTKAPVMLNTTVTFTLADFDGPYSDVETPSLVSIRVPVLPSASQGVLQLNGSPLVANTVILAANIGTLTFVPATGYTGAASFDWQASDGTDFSATNTVNMTFNANTAPTIGPVTKAAVLEDGPAVTFTLADFDGPYSDVETPSLVSIRVPALPSAGVGVLYLNGVALVANTPILAADIPTLTFDPALNYNGTAVFNWQASDGTVFSASSTVSMPVTAVNDVPTIGPVTKTAVDDGTTVTFTLADFDGPYADVETASLVSIRVTSLPSASAGVLLLNGTAVTVDQVISAANIATLTFVPTAVYHGAVSFNWQASDGTDYSTASTVNMTFNDVNDVPTIGPVTKAAVLEDGPVVTFTLADFDGPFSDVETASLYSIRVPALPSASLGVLYLNGVALTANTPILAADIPTLTFDPALNYNGTAVFNWQASDGTVFSASNTVSMPVTAVNDIPTIGPVNKAAVAEDGPAVAFALADFDGPYTDVETASLVSIRVHTLPAASAGVLLLNGTAVTVDQVIPAANIATLTFDPALNYNGTASFEWQASDGTDYSAASTVSMPVTAVNDIPTIGPVTKAAVLEDGPVVTFTLADFDGPFSDVETASLVSIRVPALPSASMGVLYLDGVALVANAAILAVDIPTLTFDPAANYNGTASFNWQASDGTTFSASNTVSMPVTAVNDVPTIAPVVKPAVDDGTTVTFTLADFDGPYADVEGTAMANIRVTTPLPASSAGTLYLNGIAVTEGQVIPAGSIATLTFVPTANYHGTVSFNWQASDGTDYSAANTVTMTFNDVNDAPVLDVPANATYAARIPIRIVVSGHDIDLPADTLAYGYQGTLPAGAQMVDGVFTWTPTLAQIGAHTITFTINDGHGTFTFTRTFTIVQPKTTYLPLVTRKP